MSTPGPFWSIIVPQETTNLIANPSAERGTVGYTGLNSASVGSTSAYQAAGAWSVFAAGANTAAGVAYGTNGGTLALGNGTTYGVSAWVNAPAGVPMRLRLASFAGASLGSVAFTGGGTWQRHNLSYTETASNNRLVIVEKANSASAGTWYVDGVQVEPGPVTTYIDGDQSGGRWLDAPHAGASVRDAYARSGGTIYTLASLGLVVEQSSGIGMPPIETAAQSYAVLPGGEVDRQRAAARPFTLQVTAIGTATSDLHATRRRVITAINPARTPTPQPIRLLYTGAGGTAMLDAYYSEGLEYDVVTAGGFSETTPIKFVAYDPLWASALEAGTALAPYVTRVYDRVARRTPQGDWVRLVGANGSAISGASADVLALAEYNPGTILVGGTFGTAGGTTASNQFNLAQWRVASSSWGSVLRSAESGAVLTGQIYALAVTPDGTIFAGGTLSSLAAGGNVLTNVISVDGPGGNARQLGTAAAYGSISGRVYALLYTPTGTLLAGGDFGFSGTNGGRSFAVGSATNGTLVPHLGGTLATSPVVRDLIMGPGGSVMVVGNYTAAGGTAARAITTWNGNAFGTLPGGTLSTTATGGDTGLNAAVYGQDGRIYVGGYLEATPLGSANSVAQYNGAAFAPMGSGLSSDGVPPVRNLALDPRDNSIYAAGTLEQINGVRAGANLALARWNGYGWLPGDLFPNGNVTALLFASDRSLYIGGNFSGTGTAAWVGTIVNAGQADAYPTLRARYTGVGGTARVYQLVNTATGDGIYFDLALLPNEEVTLTTQPGTRTLTSSNRGDVLGAIRGGSNLNSFRLLPGTNYVSFFADSASVAASLTWRPRGWSADLGTTA